ncbi:MAG: TlpA family protein disulfide reductase [Eubacteriales bacterium]|nr:TlpA family protein disulfide reductase [Eubacteriales bacterium]
MKKLLILILCISLAVVLFSCSKPENNDPPVNNTEGDNTGNDNTEGPVVFMTYDRKGNPYDQSIFAESKLTLINFWEPWCPPCVGEMPDLEKIYEQYKDKGLNIIGVYSSFDMEGDVDDVLDEAGTTYLILTYREAFDRFQTGYVPTSVFINDKGEVVGETIIGSKSYDEWVNIIEGLLNH